MLEILQRPGNNNFREMTRPNKTIFNDRNSAVDEKLGLSCWPSPQTMMVFVDYEQMSWMTLRSIIIAKSPQESLFIAGVTLAKNKPQLGGKPTQVNRSDAGWTVEALEDGSAA